MLPQLRDCTAVDLKQGSYQNKNTIVTPVGGIVRLGTPSTCVEMVLLYMEVVSNITVILSSSKLWIIKYTENPLDTNIPILIND